MKRATEPLKNTPAPSAALPSRFERLLRTVALLALGPAFVLVTPIQLGTTSMFASLIIVGSWLTSRTLPRMLAPGLGRPGAYMAASLVLGAVGALLGFLGGCSVDAALCRYSIGTWTLAWLLFPLAVLLLTGILKVFQTMLRGGLRLVRLVRRARLSR